eukprot:Sdes_comp20803_c0_seq1m17128
MDDPKYHQRGSTESQFIHFSLCESVPIQTTGLESRASRLHRRNTKCSKSDESYSLHKLILEGQEGADVAFDWSCWVAGDAEKVEFGCELMQKEGIFLFDVHTTEKSLLLHQVAQTLQTTLKLTEQQSLALEKSLLKRDEIFPHALGRAMDIIVLSAPNLVPRIVPVFIWLLHPVNFGAPDGTLCKYVWVLVGPAGMEGEISKVAFTILKMMVEETFHANIYDSETVSSRKEFLREAESLTGRVKSLFFPETRPGKSAQIVPFEIVGLERTGALFGGIKNDLSRRLPHYLSDFKDALHLKIVATTIFLLFACLTPTITFGALMRKETGGYIGISEALLATLLDGVLFSLLSCQPLVLLGTTGPFLVFTQIVFLLSQDMGIPFLGLYVWTGIWMSVFCFLIAVTDSCVYIRYFTRFADEIFCTLIAAVFFLDPWLKNIRALLTSPPIREDVILLNLILIVGTFSAVALLISIRNSPYLRPLLRELIADFGPILAILTMTLFSYLFADVPIARLHVPANLQPSIPRSWFINPFCVPYLPSHITAEEGSAGAVREVGIEGWVVFFAMLPAALGTILVYLDTNLTGRLVNSEKYHLKKGHGFHWDFMVVSLLLLFNSFMGLPWFYAGTVRTLTHTMCLASSEEVIVDGYVSRKVIKVREQRISALAIHILVGMALFFTDAINHIPLFVLLGVFMYMGYSALCSTRLWECVKLLFMERSKYPPSHIVRLLPENSIFLYTITQIFAAVFLYLISESSQFETTILPWVSLFFPFFIACLVPFHLFILPLYVPKSHIEILESE